jgi:hypothetical protein
MVINDEVHGQVAADAACAIVEAIRQQEGM